MSSWDSLSMAQRAEVMRLAVQSGVYNLDTIRSAYNEFAKGGSIHIDPFKKGTFTAAASRHNMGVQEFASKVLANKDDYSPAMVKKANFARNASKWKHEDGGLLERALESSRRQPNIYGGETQPIQQMNVMAYYPEKDYYTGPQTTLPEVTVTGEAPSWFGKKGLYPTRYRYNPRKHVSARTQQLTAGDAAKAWDTMVTPALSWALPNVFRGIDAAQRGDIDGVALEALKAVGLKGVGALASNTTRAGLFNGLNTVKTTVINPAATTRTVGTAIGNTVRNVATPGSSFWTNPLTKQFATGLGIHYGSNGLIGSVSSYSSFGDALGSAIEETTGWNPNSTVTGTFLTESLDPSWYFPAGKVMNAVGKVGSAVEETARGVADNYFFLPHPNSFTRGIGGEAGLQDLVESGLVRGNPVGTEMTAHNFAKAYRKNRNHFRDIMDATGREGIAQRYYNRTLTKEDFDAIKNAARPYNEMLNTVHKPESKRFQLALNLADIDPLSRYADFAEYQSQLASDKLTLRAATSLDDSGQPLAYFYDDGRNPLTAGHDYAASQYGVRINNASDYNPRIFEGHLHYSMPEAVSLSDPNVEVFRKGLFGITRKMNKSKLMKESPLEKSLLNFGNVEDGTFKFTGFSEDPIQMHLKRAQAKGYDTSGINIYDLSKDTPENTAFIESIAKQYGLTPEQTKEFLLNHLDTHGHAANFNNTRNIIHDGTGDNLSARISHEIDHLLHKPDEPIPDGSYYPRIFKRADEYFSKHNNTELSARGSQLHDYFGHTGNEPITEGVLEYARQHYIKDTGLDNDMHDFLWTVKDNKKVADWLTKYATGIVPFGLFGTTVFNQNKE